MKTFSIILLSLLTIFLSCTDTINRKIGSCYLQEDGMIKYLKKDETGAVDTVALKDANTAFFELIHDEMPGDECVNGNIWAKDKLHVWYKNKILPGAHPETFTLLENGYAKDKEHAYFYDQLLVNVDISSFEVLTYFFAKDRNIIFSHGKEVFGVEDKKSFEIIDGWFSKDSTGVYFNNDTVLLKLPDSDPKSFRCYDLDLSGQLSSLKYYTDKKNVYFTDTDKNAGEEDFLYVFDAFTESFEVLAEKYYSKDNFNIYYKNKIIENADAASFETLGLSYAQDRQYIYFENKRLAGADKNTFRVFKEDSDFDARDAQNYYLKGKKVREQ